MPFHLARRALPSLAAALPMAAAAQPSGGAAPPAAAPTDRLRHARAVEAAIWGMPAVNYDLMLQQMLTKTAGEENDVIYWGRPVDWRNQTLTPNPDALYFMIFLDLKAGPVVIEIPPGDAGGSLNGNIVTTWQMPLEDVGLLGMDRGAGGRFVILPPGQAQPVPEGYTALPSDTFGGFALLRANFRSHSEADVQSAIAYGKRIRVHSLSQAPSPPPTTFTDVKDVLFDSTIPFDARYFESLHRIVQKEPWLQRDRLMINTLRSIGIEKGQPFSPDAPMRDLLGAAAREAGSVLDAMHEGRWPGFFEGTSWRPAAPPEVVRMQANAYGDPDEYPTDLRAMIYTLGYVGIKRLGTGQFYLISIRDKDGQALEGSRTYRLAVPPDPPVDQYWSVTVYDRQTHALIRNMPRASRSSQIPELLKNADGSIDIFFGPSAPAGRETNWVPTDPHRPFELMFRAYAPRREFFEKVWALPDAERVAAP